MAKFTRTRPPVDEAPDAWGYEEASLTRWHRHPAIKPMLLLVSVAVCSGAVGFVAASWGPNEEAKRAAAQAQVMRQRIALLESITKGQAEKMAAMQQGVASTGVQALAPTQVVAAPPLLAPTITIDPAVATPPAATSPQANAPVAGNPAKVSKAPALPSPAVAQPMAQSSARKAADRPQEKAAVTAVARGRQSDPPAATPGLAQKAAAVKPQAAQVAQAQAPQAASPQASAPSRSTAPASSDSVVMASMQEAGVTEVRADGVRLKNGKTIRIGDSFETGEVLVSLNAAERKIQTNRRVLVLF